MWVCQTVLEYILPIHFWNTYTHCKQVQYLLSCIALYCIIRLRQWSWTCARWRGHGWSTHQLCRRHEDIIRWDCTLPHPFYTLHPLPCCVVLCCVVLYYIALCSVLSHSMLLVMSWFCFTKLSYILHCHVMCYAIFYDHFMPHDFHDSVMPFSFLPCNV